MFRIKQLGLLVVIGLTFSACSEYQKVLNKGTTEDQYKMATQLFEEGKYNKSINLFEKVIPKYGAKPQMERIQYMVGEANFKTKSYDLAAYYFERFIGNYPQSSKIEDATFLAAQSYYLSSPKASRDQANTHKALTALQNFIDKFPQSDKIEEANKYYDELSKRLEKKQFDIAKQYYITEKYNAAITAFDIFIEDNFGTDYKEEALAYKFLAAYELGMNSIITKKEQRLENAIASYNRLEKNFPESERLKDFSSKLKDLNKELEETKEIYAKYTNNGL
ncbi:outer membrane protein assembly factor BamD [Aureibaculum sp. 2210JD6-5]|uniref:outer membrane protein assembly factor BamD n=1 Tax=Aureibaculum sp. 2210JD6-5 TaxID=3103957 RepID=UPI002AAC661F|nr:outer membrane protein assembly factor BamD [Aureibaculum sp. 2210JD6-5]MDY7395477.1 outer membrane protein assembly factor BamD [Aureibaculum sp. 2210JD6-5]